MPADEPPVPAEEPIAAPGVVSEGIGALLWEENFDSFNTDVWTIDIGDGCDQGLCGWGNAELQWYSENNVSIAPIPGEGQNTALRLDAEREQNGNYVFASGKIQSENKLAVHYGLVEIRMSVPDLETGLWPAAWMLGSSTLPWPRKGEIDIMEMGHREVEKERQGHPGADHNNYVGSNLIFHADGACSDGNPTCAASLAYDANFNKPYVSEEPLSDRFVVYRLYWTDTEVRFTIVDNEVEHDLYEAPFQIGEESDEFQQPFYLLLNLAVGGTFTDAAVPNQVTAPLPGSMYVDYVRVYEFNGQGEVIEGSTVEPEEGSLGVFTETTPTENNLKVGVDSQVFLWDPNSSAGNEAPLEGDNVLSWNVNVADSWFGAGVQSLQPRDLTALADGSLSFAIKIPADVGFRIGVTDTYGNENWVLFPANEDRYGLSRDGEWGRATIPVSELRGQLIALQSVQYVFAISSIPDSLPNRTFSYSVDDIFWTEEASTASAAVEFPRDPFGRNPESVVVERNIGWVEGPTWVPDEGGFIYNLTDRDTPDIHRLWRPGEDRTSEYWRVDGSNHGAIWSVGLIFMTNREPGRIGYIDPSKNRLEETVIRDGLGRPNDLDRFSDGSIYFSDWPRGDDGVYRVHMNGDLEQVISPNQVGQPNGIAFTADCKRLYVVDTGNAVYAFDVDERGNLSNRRIHADDLGNVNGIAVDIAGNLYAPSGNGVLVFNSEGEQVGSWGGRGQRVVNMTFGGDDHKWLLTTNNSGVTAVRTQIPGAECNGLGTQR